MVAPVFLKMQLEPIETHEKEKTDTLKSYLSIQHHIDGLEILVPVFEHLYDKHNW